MVRLQAELFDQDHDFGDGDLGEIAQSTSQRVGVSRVDPWSVAKIAIIFWAAVALAVFGVVFGLWAILSISGAISNFEHFVGDLTGLKNFHVMSFSVLIGIALLGALATVVSIALTVLGAVFYNSLAPMIGGVEIDLNEHRVQK